MEAFATPTWRVGESDLRGLTPIKARDLLVDCYATAQMDKFRRTGEELKLKLTDEELRMSVELQVRTKFDDLRLDFEAPTKASLERVLAELAWDAAQWGTPTEIVEYHVGQVHRILAELPED